jgi:DNA-binding beta-propeller fold protein YncE
VSATITAGPIALEVAAAGRNPYRRAFYLDRTSALEVFLDPAGQLVHQTGVLKTAGAPKGVAVTPDGHEAWATILDGPPSIEIFDLTQMRKTGEIDIGSYGAVEIEFSRDGKRAYASQMETAKVFEIDTHTRAVLREFDTKSAWTKVVALSPSQTTLYAANWSGNDVSRIDLKTGETVDRLPAPKTPRGLWLPSEKTVYVAGFDDGSLWKVDAASGGYKQLFRSGGALRHLAGDAARGVLFSSDMGKDCVWITDLKSNKTRRFARVGHKPNTIALSPDGRVLFVSNRGENNAKSYYLPGPEWGSILILDARTGRALDAIVGGNQCTGLAVSADGRTLVFSDFLDNRLRVYDVPPYEVLVKGSGGRAKTLAKDSRK